MYVAVLQHTGITVHGIIVTLGVVFVIEVDRGKVLLVHSVGRLGAGVPRLGWFGVCVLCADLGGHSSECVSSALCSTPYQLQLS